MLTFKEVSFRNFFSYGSREVTIDITKYKTTLLTGDSGSGKSTIISESLTFGLYGKPFRKIKKNDVCNTVNGKDCCITIKFSIGTDDYKVVRGVKPDIFEIYQNEVMVNQNPSVRDYQKYLEENILQMSYKAWTQMVVLGFANHTPFMNMSAGERRTMVDEVLGIEAFQKMLATSKERVTELKLSVKELENKVEANNKTKDIQKANLLQLREQEASKTEDLQTEIEALQKEVAGIEAANVTLNHSLEDLNAKTSIRSTLQAKSKEMNSLLTKVELSKDQIDKQIKFISDNTSCPTCKQEITDEHRETFTLAESVRSLQMATAITDLQDKVSKHQKLLNEITELAEESYSIETKVQVNMKQVTYIQRAITEKQKEISKLVGVDNGLIKQIAVSIIELVEDSKRMEDAKVQLQDELRHYVFCQTLLKEDGIKGKIIAIYLPVLTKMVNEYLEKMQFMMRIQFDDSFNETIYARFRDKLTFSQLSQGEQSRINIAIILAWRALAEMRNSVKCNLIICDELLDTAISAADVETVLEMIKGMAERQHIYIISHKPDQVANHVDNVIKVEKKGNFSLITEGA